MDLDRRDLPVEHQSKGHIYQRQLELDEVSRTKAIIAACHKY